MRLGESVHICTNLRFFSEHFCRDSMQPLLNIYDYTILTVKRVKVQSIVNMEVVAKINYRFSNKESKLIQDNYLILFVFD